MHWRDLSFRVRSLFSTCLRCAFCALLFAGLTASAQTGTALSGTIKDASGAVVGRAIVVPPVNSDVCYRICYKRPRTQRNRSLTCSTNRSTEHLSEPTPNDRRAFRGDWRPAIISHQAGLQINYNLLIYTKTGTANSPIVGFE